MKSRTFKFLLVFLVILTVCTSSLSALSYISKDDDKTEYKPIVLSKESEVANEYRNLQINKVEAFYNSSSILLTFFDYLGVVNIYVYNTTSGECWNSTFDSNLSSEVLEIYGVQSSAYVIIIQSEYGDIYRGTFII